MTDIPALVRELTDKFKTNNPLELCRCLNIAVIYAELPQNINGFFSNSGGKKCVFLNKSLDKRKAQFCCAHELGHALLHDNLNSVFLSSDTYFCQQRFENQADTFAAFLLFDDAKILYNRLGLDTADDIKRYYNIDERIFALRYEKN